jgi:hypothetical protein
MLENTHRFAIHIRICKEATDEDRATAIGQLRKTKKYGMKVTRKTATEIDEFMQHPKVSKTFTEHFASLVAPSAQEALPAGDSSTRKHLDQYPSQQHYSLDVHMNFVAPVRNAQTNTSCLPMLGFDDAYYCPSSMVSASTEVSGDYFHSYAHDAPPPSMRYSASDAAPDDVVARETTRCRIFDSDHNLDSPDISTTTFYDNDIFQLLDPVTQYLRNCHHAPAIISSSHHQQQYSSSPRAMFSPSFKPKASPHDPQPFIF